MKYGTIRYNDEHIHLVTTTEEICYLSRNWSRCTAGTSHKLRDCDSKDRSYYDGSTWVKAPKPD